MTEITLFFTETLLCFLTKMFFCPIDIRDTEPLFDEYFWKKMKRCSYKINTNDHWQILPIQQSAFWCLPRFRCWVQQSDQRQPDLIFLCNFLHLPQLLWSPTETFTSLHDTQSLCMQFLSDYVKCPFCVVAVWNDKSKEMFISLYYALFFYIAYW